MNALFTAVLIGVLTGGCTSAPLQWSYRQGKAHNKRSVEQQGWTSLGYSGQTSLPVVLDDGTIAETPEVAAARAAHLATLELYRGNNPDFDDGFYDPLKYGDHLYGVSHSGDLSKSIDAHSTLAQSHSTGLVATDTQHAPGNTQYAIHSQVKASTESALAQWKANNVAAGRYSYETPAEQNKPYTGPLAMIHVLPTGYLEDTEEVADAKKTHLSALAEAQAPGALWKINHAQTQSYPWN